MDRQKWFGGLGLVAMIFSLLAPSTGYGAGKWGKKPIDYCPILDDLSDPLYQAGMTWLPATRFQGAGTSSLLEFDGDWEFGYLKNVLRGNVDLSLVAKDTLFLGSAHVDLPMQVVKLAVDGGWAGRLQKGYTLQVRAVPGLYADPGAAVDGGFFMPVSCSLIRTFSPDLAGIVGLEYRMGFEEALMPIVGLQWEVGDELRFKVGLPESKIVWDPVRDWTFRARLFWSNLSYRTDGDNDLMTIEDFRLSVGGTYHYSDRLLLIGELGYAFERSVEFDDIPAGEIGVEDTLYVRVGVGGPF